MNAQRRERGQVIVLIILAIVAMMGFVGLAVDGGRIFSEKRRAQNAADAAAYAAAMAAIEEKDPEAAAIDQAALNDFQSAGSTVVTLHHPPISGPYKDDADYYQVVIERNLGATFGRAVGMTEYVVQSEAVAHAQPIEPVQDDDIVIHALDDDGVGIEFKGNVTVKVSGGDIYSNAGIKQFVMSGKVEVEEGDIFYTRPWTVENYQSDMSTFSPAPRETGKPLPTSSIPEPDCGSVHFGPSEINQQTVFQPGIYDTKLVINKPAKFNPGMYCLTRGLEITHDVKVSGKDVVFILQGGTFLTNASTDLRLIRPNDYIDAANNQWGGMLVYAPPDNTDAIIELNGKGQNVYYAGTIFAPEGLCRVGGTAANMTVKANIVCENILFHTTPSNPLMIRIDYKQNQGYRQAPSIEMSQ